MKINKLPGKNYVFGFFFLFSLLVFGAILIIDQLKLSSRKTFLSKAAEETNSCVTQLSAQVIPLTYGPDGLPFHSRAQLDEYLLQESIKRMPELGNISLPPKSIEEAGIVRDIRAKPENWDTVCGAKEKVFEFILNQSAVDKINSMSSQWGGSIEEIFNAQFAELNRILSSAPNPLPRLAVLKRIIIVDDAVVNGQQPGHCNLPLDIQTPIPNTGWQVCNKKEYSWWANDFMNSVAGSFPFDIDGRGILTEKWAEVILSWAQETTHPLTGKTVKIDYALIHEMLHQFYFNDLYGSNPGKFVTAQENGKFLVFNGWVDENDSMAVPGVANITEISTAASHYCFNSNPKLNRPGPCIECQLGNTPFIDPFTQVPNNTSVVINYGPLAGKITNCYLGHQGSTASDYTQPVEKSEYYTAENQNDFCKVTLSGSEYIHRIFPVFYLVIDIPYRELGIQSDDILSFPFLFQRIFVNAPVWTGQKDQATITVNFSSKINTLLAQTAEIIQNSQSNKVEITAPAFSTTNYRQYVDLAPTTQDRIDKEGVFATMPFPGTQSEVVWAMLINTPSPTPTSTPTITPTLTPAPTLTPTNTPIPRSIPNFCAYFGTPIIDQSQEIKFNETQINQYWGYGAPLRVNTTLLGQLDSVQLYASGNGTLEVKLMDSNGQDVTGVVTKRINGSGWVTFDFSQEEKEVTFNTFIIMFRAPYTKSANEVVKLGREFSWNWAYRFYIKPLLERPCEEEDAYRGEYIPTVTPIPTATPPVSGNHPPTIGAPLVFPDGNRGVDYQSKKFTIYGFDQDTDNQLTMRVYGLPGNIVQGANGYCPQKIIDGKKTITCTLTGIPQSKGTYYGRIVLFDGKSTVEKNFVITIN